MTIYCLWASSSSSSFEQILWAWTRLPFEIDAVTGCSAALTQSTIVQKTKNHRKNSHLIVPRARKRVSECMSKASKANKRTDEQVAQYSSLDSWLYWHTVQSRGSSIDVAFQFDFSTMKRRTLVSPRLFPLSFANWWTASSSLPEMQVVHAIIFFVHQRWSFPLTPRS